MTRDPVTGLGVQLDPEGHGRILLCDAQGRPAGAIEAPAGYRLSHIVVEPARLLVVGQGEVAVDGWPDWHFEIDAANGRLARAGPAF